MSGGYEIMFNSTLASVSEKYEKKSNSCKDLFKCDSREMEKKTKISFLPILKRQ